MRIICVCTGTKFEEWYVDNLKYMIDTYTDALEFTKKGKSKKLSELALKKLETHLDISLEI